jgi:hypothetical protein
MWGHRAQIPPIALNRRSVIDYLANLRGDVILESWGAGDDGQSLVFGFERVRERDTFCERFHARPGTDGDIEIPTHRWVDDDLQTPKALARAIVEHFQPQGRMLEPCAGDGAFLECMPCADWCEVKEDRDFFQYRDKVDWIVTGPPYLQRLEFLVRSLQLAENIVFLVHVPLIFFKAKLHLIHHAGCAVREIVLVDNPPEPWPQFGLQLSAVHIKRGHPGGIKVTDKRGEFPVTFD